LTVIRPGDEALYEAAALGVDKLLPAVHGGGTRQQSVLNGLRALADKEPSLVLIHDAARPFTSRAVIERVIASREHHCHRRLPLPIR
jgi:2-C-methyl-D-erythritol 4-phosphate cytidylyltransferase/2-C-methyl-D-erythritol 2,4-cyclodiphosphate synthase